MQIFSLLFLQIAQLLENIRSHTTSQTLLYGYKKSSCWKEYSSKRVAIKRSHKNKTISLYNCFILFSHVYLFVFRNDYKISGDTVFLSVILKNLILIIKSHWKSKLSPIELFTFHLSIETHFSRLQQSFFTKLCLKFLLICPTWEVKSFYQTLWGNEFDFTNKIYVSPKISAQD